MKKRPTFTDKDLEKASKKLEISGEIEKLKEFAKNLMELKKDGKTTVDFLKGNNLNRYSLKLNQKEIHTFEKALDSNCEYYEALAKNDLNEEKAFDSITDKTIAKRVRNYGKKRGCFLSFLSPNLEKMFSSITPRAEFVKTIHEYD